MCVFLAYLPTTYDPWDDPQVTTKYNIYIYNPCPLLAMFNHDEVLLLIT